jgi:cytochrome P450
MFRFPFAYSLQQGNLVHDTKKFHDKYGPIVRLAPNELSFIDANAWQDIYGHRKRGHKEFTKNPIWAQPAPNGVLSMINAKEEDHPRMRKPFVPGFSQKSLKAQEGIMQGYIDLLMRQLKKHIENGQPVVDIKDYYNWTTFDIIGDLGFGEPFDCLQTETYHAWVSFLFGHLKDGALMASVNFYPWISGLLFALLPKSAFNEAQAHFKMSCEKLSRRMGRKDDGRTDLMTHVLSLGDDRGLSLPELEATSAIIILAGSESTSTMLTGTTNLLVRNPSKLAKLVNEIRTAFPKESDIKLDPLEQLPYLQAVFREGFRLLPPVPTQIPRIVPSEGDVVCGHVLPGNVSLMISICFPSHVQQLRILTFPPRPSSASPNSPLTATPATLPTLLHSFPSAGSPQNPRFSLPLPVTLPSQQPHSPTTSAVSSSPFLWAHGIVSE